MNNPTGPHIDYKEALVLLGRALVFGINPSLEGVRALVARLGDPQRSFVPIQVTGTNGKTSTTILIDTILRSQEQKVGRFTSPELINYTERISLNGRDIFRKEFAEAFESVLAQVGENETTEFELLTAMAFVAFREHNLDFGVLEVGMGGRWDATSVCEPAVAVITGVGLDHMLILGATTAEIALDKSMIIKPGSTPILGRGFDDVLPVFLNRSAEYDLHPRLVRMGDEETFVHEDLTTRFYVHEQTRDTERLVKTTLTVKTPHAVYDGLEVSMPAYQAQNIATALTAAEAALGRELDACSVRTALADVIIPGRFEAITLNPLTIFDGGHNAQAAGILSETLRSLDISPVVAFGAYSDKDTDSMLEALSTISDNFIAIGAVGARALSAQDIAVRIEQVCGEVPLATLSHASLEQLRHIAGEKPLLITGSLSLYHLLKS